MHFPELSLWRDLRERLRTRTVERSSKWDARASFQPSAWATPWRDKLRELLAVGVDEAVPITDKEIRSLGATILKDFAEFARTEDAHRAIELFTAEMGATDSQGVQEEWAFVPVADVLLVVGEEMIGLTSEGVFLEALQGVPVPPAAASSSAGDEGVDEKDKKDDDRKDGRLDGKSAKKAQMEAAEQENFDWEKVWRTKSQVSKWKNNQRKPSNWQRGHSPVRGRSSSPSGDRRRRGRGRRQYVSRSRSRGRRNRDSRSRS
jgi:hypothetical protein